MTSPFLIKQEFFSPKLCEQMVDSLNFVEPNLTQEELPAVTIRTNELFEQIVYEKIQEISPEVEAHYEVQYRGMKPVKFYWYPEEYGGDVNFTCENAIYKNKKWVKNKDRDLTGIVFMSDYNSKVPFESEYEVYGGKVEYPQHQFGFQAERGTLILYPSDPHFLNRVGPIIAGDLFVAKFHIGTALPFMYDPTKFPGDYKTWFEEIA